MSLLLQTYGTCTIPKGTVLFRSNTPVHPDQIFFALQIEHANDFNNEDKRVQIWKCLRTIEVLFMVSEISDSRAWVQSSICDICCEYFPEHYQDEICFSEDIKHFDKAKLQRLVKKMKEENIKGWFTSIKDHVDCEVCLFDQSIIKLVEITESFKPHSYYNALKKLKFEPAIRFFKKSENITKRYGGDYKTHLRWYKYTVKSAAERGEDSEKTRYEFYNLRLKLKIRLLLIFVVVINAKLPPHFIKFISLLGGSFFLKYRAATCCPVKNYYGLLSVFNSCQFTFEKI